MRADQLTLKAQEALGEAQRQAREAGHAEVSLDHLLKALLDQEEGIVAPILAKIGVARDAVSRELDASLARRARVSGSAAEPQVAPALAKVLDRALEIAHKFQDEYVSTEHV